MSRDGCKLAPTNNEHTAESALPDRRDTSSNQDILATYREGEHKHKCIVIVRAPNLNILLAPNFTEKDGISNMVSPFTSKR